MEYIFLIFMSENLMAIKGGKREDLPFRYLSDLDINYPIEVSDIDISVFILLFKFQ